jgi:hypothetical protein
MITQFRPTFGGRRSAGRAIPGALLLACLAAFACSEDRKEAADYDVAVHRIDLIPAGTVIGKEAPSGWSHLILKSHPRAGAGDYRLLSEDSTRLAGLLFTAIVADVKEERGRYHLDHVADGMGTRIGDQDVIVTPDSQERLGAGLGFLARIVLSTAQERLQEVQLVARSPTFALIDAPNLMLRQGRHRPVVLRYAILVEEKTGRLDTLLWLLDRNDRGGYTGPVGPADWLAPAKIDDCVLHVDRREFTLGTPTEKAFAMNRLPRGEKQVAFPASLKGLASRTHFSAATAADLEAGLRAALKSVGR